MKKEEVNKMFEGEEKNTKQITLINIYAQFCKMISEEPEGTILSYLDFVERFTNTYAYDLVKGYYAIEHDILLAVDRIYINYLDFVQTYDKKKVNVIIDFLFQLVQNDILEY